MPILLFFHSCANRRRRKSSIFSLDHEGIYLIGEESIRDHIYKFYKNLFGSECRQGVNLSKDIWSLKYKVYEEDRKNLLQDLSEEENWKIIKDLPSDSAPRPNGFPTFFYKNFWGAFKQYFLEMVKDFFYGKLDL